MYQNILVPVVLAHTANTDAAIELAQSLKKEGGSITLLNVIDPVFSANSPYMPKDIIAKNKETTEAEIKELASKVDGTKVVILPAGSPGVTITNYASENQVDLIIIASHKPGLSDYFLGSTAARVVRHATCAVHVIR